MPVKITDYQLGWHSGKGSGFRYKLENGGWSAWVMLPSAADLAAIAAIFNESPCYLQSDGSLTTGLEQIGGT